MVGGFSIRRFLVYIEEEILIVLGTSSSESVLPSLMEKMERLGCSKSVVGLVIPTGYSFNLDGTSIYMTLAALFVAQATKVRPLSASSSRSWRRHADLEGRGGRDRRRFYDPGRHAILRRSRLVPVMSLVLGIDAS